MNIHNGFISSAEGQRDIIATLLRHVSVECYIYWCTKQLYLYIVYAFQFFYQKYIGNRDERDMARTARMILEKIGDEKKCESDEVDFMTKEVETFSFSTFNCIECDYESVRDFYKMNSKQKKAYKELSANEKFLWMILFTRNNSKGKEKFNRVEKIIHGARQSSFDFFVNDC